MKPQINRNKIEPISKHHFYAILTPAKLKTNYTDNWIELGVMDWDIARKKALAQIKKLRQAKQLPRGSTYYLAQRHKPSENYPTLYTVVSERSTKSGAAWTHNYNPSYGG